MKTKLLPIALASVAILLFSCQSSVSIAKKRYSNGYYVNVSHDAKEKAENKEVAEYKKEITAASKEVKIEKKNIEMLSTAAAPVAPLAKEVSEAKTSPVASTAPTSKTIQKLKEAVKKKAIEKKIIADDEGQMSDKFLIVLLFTILIPPIGVYLFKENLRAALIDLLIIIVGIILAQFLPFFVYGLGYLAGLIYGLLYIFEKI